MSISEYDRTTATELLSQYVDTRDPLGIECSIHANSDGCLHTYKDLIFDIILQYVHKSDANLDTIGMNSELFDDVKHRINEQDNFLTNPVEVEEGVFQCVCGCKKTFSYQKQTRSSDESITVFVTCSKCGRRWKEG